MGGFAGKWRKWRENERSVCQEERSVRQEERSARQEELPETEPGEIDPDHVVTPGIFVKRVVVAPRVKRIERRTVRKG